MKRLLKPQIQKRAEEIKCRMLHCKPFEQPLGVLYQDLRLAGKHEWTVQVYHFLLLYVPNQQKNRLFHPALLQAFLSLGLYEQARLVAQVLAAQNPNDPEIIKLSSSLRSHNENFLPSYTPLASLSKYAASKETNRSAVPSALPQKWQQWLQAFTPDKLQQTGYFEKRKQLARAPLKYRTALLQALDELTCCYLLEQRRAVAALSGALLEILLALLILKKLHKHKIAVEGQKAQDILDLHLNQLITICAQKELLPPNALKLLRTARVQRNFIHPGKELLENSPLSPAGARICFLAVMEIIDVLFSSQAAAR